jgi:hypothetical protein
MPKGDPPFCDHHTAEPLARSALRGLPAVIGRPARTAYDQGQTALADKRTDGRRLICREDAVTTARMPPQGWSMDRGTTPGMGEIDRVGNKRSRAAQGAVAETIRHLQPSSGGTAGAFRLTRVVWHQHHFGHSLYLDGCIVISSLAQISKIALCR